MAAFTKIVDLANLNQVEELNNRDQGIRGLRRIEIQVRDVADVDAAEPIDGPQVSPADTYGSDHIRVNEKEAGVNVDLDNLNQVEELNNRDQDIQALKKIELQINDDADVDPAEPIDGPQVSPADTYGSDHIRVNEEEAGVNVDLANLNQVEELNNRDQDIQAFRNIEIQINDAADVDPAEPIDGPQVSPADTYGSDHIRVNEEEAGAIVDMDPSERRLEQPHQFDRPDSSGMGPTTHLDVAEFPNFFRTIWRKPIILVLGFSGNLGGLIIGLLGGLIQQRKSSSFKEDFLTIVISISSMAGAAIAALMSDLVGRKIGLILADLLLAIGWSIIIFTENSKLALTGLIVTGVAIGFTSLASAMYTSETSPPHIRGRMTSLMGILTTFGLLISYVITNSRVRGAHFKALEASILAIPVLQATILYLMPESPIWLVKNGKILEAFSSLAKIHPKEEAIKVLDRLIALTSRAEERSVYKIWFSAIVDARFRVALRGGVCLQFLSQTSGFIVVSYYKFYFFKKAGCSKDVQNWASLLLEILGAAGNLGVFDQMERKKFLMYTSWVLGFNLLGLGGFVYYVSTRHVPSSVILLGAIPLLASYDLAYSGMGSAPWVVSCELHPLKYRALGVASGAVARFVGNLLVALTIKKLKEKFKDSGIFLFYSVVTFLGLVAIHYLVPRTNRFEDEAKTEDNGGELLIV